MMCSLIRKHDNHALKVSYTCNYLKLVLIIYPLKNTVPCRTNQFLDFRFLDFRFDFFRFGKEKDALSNATGLSQVRTRLRQVVKATSIQYC